MAGMKPFLGIDIGGTNIKLATVSPTARVVERGLVETRASEGAARAFARIHAAARTLGPNGIAGVGIGCAGLFDERRGVLTASPNLKAWQGTKLTALAAKHFSVPILIQNDATVAAYGESVVRGPRGRNLVLITLGTGVGGGIVADGRIVRGVSGFGGEIGHMVVNSKRARVPLRTSWLSGSVRGCIWDRSHRNRAPARVAQARRFSQQEADRVRGIRSGPRRRSAGRARRFGSRVSSWVSRSPFSSTRSIPRWS
jgi:predicted NBD/HSP70 family sugar kinase